jgi:hypothetical protein
MTDPDKASNNRTLIPRIAPEHQLRTLRGLRRR